MIWKVILVIVGGVIVRFLLDLSDDNKDLKDKTIVQKFEILSNIINQYAYNGLGRITMHPKDKRSFHIYKDLSNQIIVFEYGTGHLTITWKYKYLQQEVVHSETYHNLREISDLEQEKIATEMIIKMKNVIQNHIKNIDKLRM